MIIAEIPKANYCSFFCFLLTMDECIINVWGYTEILPKFLLMVLATEIRPGLQRCLGVRHSGWANATISSMGEQTFTRLTSCLFWLGE